MQIKLGNSGPCMCVSMYACGGICVFMYVCACGGVCVFMYACACVCKNIYIFIYALKKNYSGVKQVKTLYSGHCNKEDSFNSTSLKLKAEKILRAEVS